MEFGYLAAPVAGMVGWIALMIDRVELNLDAADSGGLRTKPLAGRTDLLGSLAAAVARARRALQSTTTNTWPHRGHSRWGQNRFQRTSAAS